MDALNRKEAIIMGDDITPVTREEYCLKELAAGGGGSLDYVVPEQTLTFETGDSEVEIGENNLDDIQVGNSVIAKVYYSSQNFTEYYWMYCAEEGLVGGSEALFFHKIDNKWKATLNIPQAPYPLTTTISAIRGF